MWISIQKSCDFGGRHRIDGKWPLSAYPPVDSMTWEKAISLDERRLGKHLRGLLHPAPPLTPRASPRFLKIAIAW